MEALLVLALFLGLVSLFGFGSTAARKGAAGEARVSAALRSAFREPDYRILTDLTIPTDRGTTQIDHVVLSRYGLHIIETKNMSGWIFGDPDAARWTQVLHRKKTSFQNPIKQNYAHLKAIEAVLGIAAHQMHNLVVFVGSAVPRTDMPENVCWSRSQLVASISASRNVIVDPDRIGAFADRLEGAALPRGRRTTRDHIAALKRRDATRRDDPSACPRCAGPMVDRKARASSRSFLGCRRYPACKGTREISILSGTR